MSAMNSPDGTERWTTDNPTNATESDQTRGASARDRVSAHDLLVVGTFGGGGINQYIDQQVDRLESRMSVSTHDMEMPPSGSGVLWALHGFFIGLAAMVRFPFREQPDIVHIHTSHQFSFYRSTFYVLYSKYVWNVPIVLHIHGSSFDDFVASASPPVVTLQRCVLGAADDVIVLSEYWEEVLTDRVPAEQTTVLPNAVEPGAYDPVFDTDSQRIVFISNLIERKGVFELVEALDQLLSAPDIDPDVHIAGAGPLSDHVEELAATHSEVTYHGYVSERKKRELLCDGSVFVLPTHADGLPIALLEGMAAGNAVVSTPVGSIPEVVDDDTGRLVPPSDADTLAATLESLLLDPEKVTEMGRTNRRQIEETYSWTQVIEQLVDIYAERV